MRYLYFPGCCCADKASGKGYDESLEAVFHRLGVEREELEDWNCCGATMYMSVDEYQAFAMAARNLALAERQAENNDVESVLLTPCAACYAVLNKTHHYLETYPEVRRRITGALSAAGLTYQGSVRIRHPLDILVNEVGLETITRAVKRPLQGVKIACYYGCLLLRPYASFDNPYHPVTMDHLMEAIGAEAVDWPLKARCCGGALTGTINEIGVRLSYIILSEALRMGAEVIATACPFCQFNLECFQQDMQRKYQLKRVIPVAYFSQLLGVALGCSEREVGLQHLFRPLPLPELSEESSQHVSV
jgi:heterodisulfide reductase subunit B